MNICSIIIGIFLLVFILIGWAQGMFKVMISVAGLIASILISLYGAPYISGYIQKNTQIDDKIAGYIADELKYSDAGREVTRGVQVSAINSLPLPETLKTKILNNNNSEMYDALEVSGVYDYISKSIAVVILNATVFLALILICRILFFFIGKRFKDLSKLPILHSIDKMGGGILGALRGLIWIWIFFLFLSITSTMKWSGQIIEQVCQTTWLRLLYNHNLLVDWIADLTRVLF